MLRLLADENFNRDIVRDLLLRERDSDILRVQDVGLRGADDPDILAWAADQGRIVLTHDRATICRSTLINELRQVRQCPSDRRTGDCHACDGPSATVCELVTVKSCGLDRDESRIDLRPAKSPAHAVLFTIVKLDAPRLRLQSRIERGLEFNTVQLRRQVRRANGQTRFKPDANAANSSR